MKGIVVYQSWWGSCKRIAEAIGSGLSECGHDVRIAALEDVDTPDPSLEFVVIGAATRWPGARSKIKHFAKKVIHAGCAGRPFATFSTGGFATGEKANRQASEVLYELLEAGGLVPLAPPLKAGIEGYKPPGIVKGTLPDSEVARAEEFGRELGAKLRGN